MQTLTEVRTELTAWYAARAAIANGQSFSMNGRSLSRANLPDINANIAMLERKEKSLQNAAAGRSPFGASLARFRD